MTQSLYDIPVERIDGTTTTLAGQKGEVLLIVNVASKCGLTPQYDALEKLYGTYRDRGFAVLGFPANDFAGQEPGSNAEIAEFCRSTFGVDFPMFAKIAVKGENRHPLYDHLIAEMPAVGKRADLPAGTAPADISWNFEKFLVDRDGAVVARFAPRTVPDDPAVVQAVEAALG